MSNGGSRLINSGYMMLDETKLYRCDLKNSDPLLQGHEYYIKNDPLKKKVQCQEDPTGPTESMQCPWSRWSDEIMAQLVTAKRSPGVSSCPPNPYAESGVNTFYASGLQCHHYMVGEGTNFTTEYWLTTEGVPIKENQQMTGKGGFTVTTYYSDWKPGEPPGLVFSIPAACHKHSAPGMREFTSDWPEQVRLVHSIPEQLVSGYRDRRDLLLAALRGRAGRSEPP